MDVVPLVTEVLHLCQSIGARAQVAKVHKQTCNALARFLERIEAIHKKVLQSPELANDKGIAPWVAELRDQLQKAKVLMDSYSKSGMLSARVFSKKKKDLKEVEAGIQIYVSCLNVALTVITSVLNSEPGQSSSTGTSISTTSQPPSAAPADTSLVSSYGLSARSLSITWGDDTRYWEWTRRAGSRFEEVAHLKLVCWLQVTGTMSCNLEAGSYTLSWRLHMEQSSGSHGWGRVDGKPVIFQFETSQGDEGCRTSQDLMLYEHETRHTGDGWRELDVGEFVVSPDSQRPLQITFSMSETEGLQWKGGLFLDGVLVQKTSELERPQRA